MSDQITERDRQAAKKLISKYNLHPSDEDKIAAMISARIADGDIGQFIEDFLKLKKPLNNLRWLSDETDEERKRRESLKAERAQRLSKKSVEWKPTPLMTREQIAKLVIGQEVGARLYGPFGCNGKVVKITDDSVEVQSSSDLVIYRFDKNGVETGDSRRRRVSGIEEEFFTGDWHLCPESEPMCLEQESSEPDRGLYLWVPSARFFRSKPR